MYTSVLHLASLDLKMAKGRQKTFLFKAQVLNYSNLTSMQLLFTVLDDILKMCKTKTFNLSDINNTKVIHKYFQIFISAFHISCKSKDLYARLARKRQV